MIKTYHQRFKAQFSYHIPKLECRVLTSAEWNNAIILTLSFIVVHNSVKNPASLIPVNFFMFPLCLSANVTHPFFIKPNRFCTFRQNAFCTNSHFLHHKTSSCVKSLSILVVKVHTCRYPYRHHETEPAPGISLPGQIHSFPKLSNFPRHLHSILLQYA